MTTQPEFDLEAAHRFFSADCFNKAWDLIDKATRSPEEDEEMIRLSVASIWHWTQRKDHTQINLSVGYWQLSRIFALLKRPEDARRCGLMSLNLLPDEDALPFYKAYAYEALARTESLAGNIDQKEHYLKTAMRLAALLDDPQDKQQLLNDLRTLSAEQ